MSPEWISAEALYALPYALPTVVPYAALYALP